MRSFVLGLGFVSPQNRAPDIIASLEIPPSTDLTSGSEFYSYLTILYWLVSFITMLLQGSRGREDWWRSSGTYFSREGGRDANTAGVIWIFYGGDDRRKIEVGLLDNKLIRSWRKLRNSKLLYQPRYIFLVSPTQSFQHRIVNLTEESFSSEWF